MKITFYLILAYALPALVWKRNLPLGPSRQGQNNETPESRKIASLRAQIAKLNSDFARIGGDSIIVSKVDDIERLKKTRDHLKAETTLFKELESVLRTLKNGVANQAQRFNK
eukprot:NODE_206_length_14836_cov_0.232408.p6 type:complete len:112 gc:universal NODE_206_length_14836_cov_0.232408:1510-1175(-)